MMFSLTDSETYESSHAKQWTGLDAGLDAGLVRSDTLIGNIFSHTQFIADKESAMETSLFNKSIYIIWQQFGA